MNSKFQEEDRVKLLVDLARFIGGKSVQFPAGSVGLIRFKAGNGYYVRFDDITYGIVVQENEIDFIAPSVKGNSDFWDDFSE
jgi:hypothetical protein